MAEHCDSPDAFLFLDPPYVGFDHYPGARVLGDEQFGRREHEALFDLFEESRARCLLIVADSPLMRELYRGYVRAAYAKNYSMKRNRQVARSTHLIITKLLGNKNRQHVEEGNRLSGIESVCEAPESHLYASTSWTPLRCEGSSSWLLSGPF